MDINNIRAITLNKCHEYKVGIYSYCFNAIALILFISITGIILYCCYKGKYSPRELNEKMIRDQEYVLSKIRYYQNEKNKISTSTFTELPFTYNPNT